MKYKNILLKTVVLSLIISIFLSSSALAAEVKSELSLEEATKRAIDTSKFLELNRLGLENTKVGLSQARYSERQFRKMDRSKDPIDQFKVGMLPGQQVFNLEEETMSMAKELEIEEASMKAESIKKSLESNVSKLYYGILQAEEMLKIKKDTLSNLEENYKITKRKNELGTASKSQLYMVEIDLNQGKIEVEKAENTYKDLVRSLNNLLNYPLDTKLKLTSSFKMKDKNIDLEKDLKEALVNRYDFKNTQNTVKLAKKNFDVVKKSFTPNTFKYKEADINYQTAKYLEDSFQKDIELDIKAKYDNIISNKKEINLMDTNVKKAEEAYRIAKVQYDLNTSTVLELNEALVMLSQAKLGRASAIANYNTSLIDYSIAVKIGNLN